MNTLQYTGTLVITKCWCGIALGIPSDLYRWANASSRHVVYCPLGHEFLYTENETDKANARAAEAERRLQLSRASVQAARDQAAAAERSARALRGHITRLRNRIANGVCPVKDCHRPFTNVREHITSQHPDWAHEHLDALA